MNIFEALRESHEQQRNLAERLIQTSGHTQEKNIYLNSLRMNSMRIQLPKTVIYIFL
jgi:hypothetical protein